MKQICSKNKATDIMETVPQLAVNLTDGIETGNVIDTCVPAHYNGQASIEEVGSRVREPFDVIEFERSYTKLRKYVNDHLSDEEDQ